MNKGTERLIACADIKHRIFPSPLFLSREELMNSARHGATYIRFQFKELADGRVQLTAEDDGRGDANVARLQSPSEVNGGGTSRYAAGLSIARLKRGGPDAVWSAAWKQMGEDEARYMTNDRVETKTAIPFAKYHPWIEKRQHGFIHMSTIRSDNLEGLELENLIPTMREILCTSMRPETLKALRVEVVVEDKTGKLIGSSMSTDERDPWKTFEEVVTGPASKVMTKQFRCGDMLVTVKYVIAGKSLYSSTVKKADKGGRKRTIEFIPHFPNYGVVSSSTAFISQEGFVVEDSPLAEALEQISHSLNYRYMFVDFSLAERTTAGPLTSEEVEQLPTPASTKTGYLKSCPIYQAAMLKARTEKPPTAEWLSWDATAPVHVAPALKVPKAEPAPTTSPAASKVPALPPSPPPQTVTVPTVDTDIPWVRALVRNNEARLKKPAVLSELRKLLGL